MSRDFHESGSTDHTTKGLKTSTKPVNNTEKNIFNTGEIVCHKNVEIYGYQQLGLELVVNYSA